MLRERLKQAGLRFKLIILVVAVSTIPLSIMGTITFHTTDDDLVEHLEARLTDVAERLQDQADRYLLDRMNLMRGLAASAENGRDLGEAQLQAQLAVHGDFQGLAVVDRDGEPVTLVGDMGADSPRERRRWLRDTPGDPRMRLSTDDNAPAVLMAVPIHEGEHLVGRLSLSELSELITEIQIGETGTAALFGANDRLLAGDEASWSQRASAGGDFTGVDNTPRWGVARSLSRVSDQYGLNLGVLVAQESGELYGLVTWLWWLLWGLWVIAFLVALTIGWIYAGVLTRPLRALAEALEGISRGDTDLDYRLEIATGDEIGRTSKAFNGVMDRLDSLIQRVAKAADGIAALARHLEQQSTDMTSSTEEQRNSVEQVATAMNEMAATVQEVARNTQSAADQATQANDAAGEGRRIVEATRESIGALAREVAQARTVIHELKDDSDNIGSILQVIEEIADQTNLLALNAAIEAARAGESGRGFAVVADEVRSLAGRTSNSTTEIKDIITRLQSGTERAVAVMDEGTHRAEASVERSREAEQSLDEIHQAVEGITDMTSQIATSSEEQRQVAEDINANVHRVNDVAASNVDSAAEVQRSVAHLEQLARELADEVAHFRH